MAQWPLHRRRHRHEVRMEAAAVAMAVDERVTDTGMEDSGDVEV